MLKAFRSFTPKCFFMQSVFYDKRKIIKFYPAFVRRYPSTTP